MASVLTCDQHLTAGCSLASHAKKRLAFHVYCVRVSREALFALIAASRACPTVGPASLRRADTHCPSATVCDRFLACCFASAWVTARMVARSRRPVSGSRKSACQPVENPPPRARHRDVALFLLRSVRMLASRYSVTSVLVIEGHGLIL